MPRNASGVMSLVAGNPVIGGTTITTSWANTTLPDIATEITDSLDRSGKGPMLAQLKAFSGTLPAPGISWASELDSGLYRASSKHFGMAVNGVLVQRWNDAEVGFVLPVNFDDDADFAQDVDMAQDLRVEGIATFDNSVVLTGGAVAAASITAVADVIPAIKATGSAAVATVRMIPQASDPTGPNVVGDLYVNTTGGKLKICTVAGSPGTWTVVGTQT